VLEVTQTYFHMSVPWTVGTVRTRTTRRDFVPVAAGRSDVAQSKTAAIDPRVSAAARPYAVNGWAIHNSADIVGAAAAYRAGVR
jgi:hypothetical protein